MRLLWHRRKPQEQIRNGFGVAGVMADCSHTVAPTSNTTYIANFVTTSCIPLPSGLMAWEVASWGIPATILV